MSSSSPAGDELLYFDRSRRWGRELNRLQHRVPIAYGYGTRTQQLAGRARYPLGGRVW